MHALHERHGRYSCLPSDQTDNATYAIMYYNTMQANADGTNDRARKFLCRERILSYDNTDNYASGV